ncbi:peptidylprolyl isomerase [Polymorphobacter fuscus]|uniref:Parvulin-like PPIase n=1 Tax=Sandarakinorhabdus fusca TaxID=1439888 RepID=A0A7C9KK65_9SPHN|nr:peptidylprolyl isomerase [Polymorphobacter fuscus]KAB7648720.1 peptidylprolyl isomerase [Polymorphobacter fuscus]MQT16283.1 peptidylprolyl isomerase [Polymorphobacter fuscus]NJC07432.1 peptidyl-prolyl cis-trans isomerase SurA [Polymorphobacter fuscus]
MRLNRRFAVLLLASAVPLAAPVGSQEAPRQSFSAEDLPELQVMGETDPTLRKAQAIVNGDVITDTDIDQRMGLVLAANNGNISEAERPRLRLQVMRNLIDEKLQLQEAASNDIKISEAEVDRSFDRVAQNFKKSPAAFEAYLREAGSSPAAIKGQIRGEIAWSRVLRRKVEPLVNVGDDEVQAVIAKLNAAKGKDEYHVGEIFLSATPETEAQVLNDAARIVGQVRQGASFVAYARQFSEASTAGLGGDLGWVRAEQLNDAVAPIVTTLTPGNPTAAVSDPIRVPGGVAIMSLLGKRQVLAGDPSEAILSLKQISLPLPANTTEAQARDMVKTFQAATLTMGGCGGAEAIASKVGAQVAVNDAIRMKDLPVPLQNVLGNLQIGQATPPFGSQQEGLRVLVLCGRDDSAAQVKAPNFEEIYAQMNDERVNMRARRYLRDLRRDAIVDYR